MDRRTNAATNTGQMDKTTYSLLESFEIDGRWWLPGRPDTVITGTLRYSPEELVLILNGCFDEPKSVELGAVPHDFERFSQIHGLLDNGHRCTLVNAFVTKRQHNLRKTLRLECSAFYLLIGHHVPDIATLTLASVTFGCTHLASFLNIDVFRREESWNGTHFQGLTIRYSVPPEIVFRVEAIPANVDLKIPVSHCETRTEIVLTAEPWITITPDSPRDVEWHITTIWRFIYLLTLLMNEAVVPTWLRFTTSQDETTGWILYKTLRPDRLSETASPLLLFYMAHVREKFSSICDKWFTVSDVLLDSIHLFMDAVRDHGTSLQGRFLTLSQALEAFSRATTTSEYMSQTDYDRVISDLAGAIPDSVSSDHRASLKSRIKYGNEHSLRKRLTHLVGTLTADTVSCVCTWPKNFVAGVVDTRNYLTHYTDELRPKALRGAALHWACEKMTMLLRILFLRHLGIDESVIGPRIREHPHLGQHIYLQQRHAECVQEQESHESSPEKNGDVE